MGHVLYMPCLAVGNDCTASVTGRGSSHVRLKQQTGKQNVHIVFANQFTKHWVKSSTHKSKPYVLFIFLLAYRSGMVSIRNEHVHTHYKHAYAHGQKRCNGPELNTAVTVKLSQEP